MQLNKTDSEMLKRVVSGKASNATTKQSCMIEHHESFEQLRRILKKKKFCIVFKCRNDIHNSIISSLSQPWGKICPSRGSWTSEWLVRMSRPAISKPTDQTSVREARAEMPAQTLQIRSPNAMP